MSHRAGVPGLDSPVAFEAVHDWAYITERIAAEPHWFAGESVLCYHYSTYGLILGEIVRRVDGRGPARFFREEVGEPAGIDLQIGLGSQAERARLAHRSFLGAPQLPDIDDKLVARVVGSIGPGDLDSWERQRAELPSGNGYANARAIARLAAIYGNGGELDGARYLSKSLVDEASREQVFAREPFFGPLRMGLGFGLDSEGMPAATPTTFHWGGQGGSLISADQATGIGFGYAMNAFYLGLDLLEHPRFLRLWSALGEVTSGL
jgi:CubicO group peptidase (beta-lactamase class C family)